MKNLLIYTNPNKRFVGWTANDVKIQIDNSLDLGWSCDDILLYTNFPYEYNGVKARIVPDIYVDFDPTANKIPVIVWLLKNDMSLWEDIYWYHDFDAYQNEEIHTNELDPNMRFGVASYAYKPEWNLGCFFFRPGALELFETLDSHLYAYPRTRVDEKTFRSLVKKGIIPTSHFTEINVTYNLTMRYVHRTYPIATKPLKVLHFHPEHNDERLPAPTLDIFMYGKNRMGIPLMSRRLIDIFQRHGIK